jgi:hypothetical protein
LSILRQRFKAASYTVTGVDVPKLFKYYDRDNSGELEHCDMRNLLATIELKGVLVELPSMINRWLQIGSAGGSARPHPLPPTPPRSSLL